MADAERKLNNGKSRIDFQADPSKYRHWKLTVDGDVATLLMDVDEKGTLFEGYELKLNSYDLGVDIELADAIERLRFEHPQVKVILLRSGKPRVFCAGANIRMLAGASHAHKVNFCKFTNETRNGIEDASEASGLFTICVINGTAAGGGYELALAADHIMLIDDGSSVVQNTSARSRRTLRLSVTRVSPPVPGSTASSGNSGSDTAEEPSSINMMWSAASASS
jgi:benzoyl-CoA-dihydrodiol lyase